MFRESCVSWFKEKSKCYSRKENNVNNSWKNLRLLFLIPSSSTILFMPLKHKTNFRSSTRGEEMKLQRKPLVSYREKSGKETEHRTVLKCLVINNSRKIYSVLHLSTKATDQDLQKMISRQRIM